MTAAAAIRRAILRKLANGPAWARSFQATKAHLVAAEKAGLVERVATPRGRGRNMVRLTAAGEAALERIAG